MRWVDAITHQWLSGHEFEQTQGDREGQGNQACAAVRGAAKSDAT